VSFDGDNLHLVGTVERLDEGGWCMLRAADGKVWRLPTRSVEKI
jgi:hypothetical protein